MSPPLHTRPRFLHWIQRSTSQLLLSPLLERMFFHPFFFVDLLFVDLTDVVIEDVSFSGGRMGSPILRTIGRTLTLTLFTDSPPEGVCFVARRPSTHRPPIVACTNFLPKISIAVPCVYVVPGGYDRPMVNREVERVKEDERENNNGVCSWE